jgi:hypothetical protein
VRALPRSSAALLVPCSAPAIAGIGLDPFWIERNETSGTVMKYSLNGDFLNAMVW